METGSLIFGKPKLNDGTPAGAKTGGMGFPVAIGPKIFCSYSCSCWETAALRNKEMKIRDAGDGSYS